MSRRPARWLRGLPWLLLRIGRVGGGHAVGTLSVWVWYERATLRLWRVQHIQPGSVLMVSEGRHHGQPVSLADGTVVRSGDPIIEFHFDNDLVAEALGSGQLTPWRFMHQLRVDLQALAERMAAGEYPDARALHGVSLFAAPGRRFGLELHQVPDTPYWRLVRYFMVGLLALHHPEGWARVEHLRDTAWPQEVWASRAAFLARARSRDREGPDPASAAG